MPIHGIYTNGAVTIRVNKVDGRISYQSETQGYNGHLDYELTASALEIHTLVAEPPGSKLGAFLVWISQIPQVLIEKTKSKQRPRPVPQCLFYASMKFAPDPTEMENAMEAALGMEGARPPHEYVATWVARTGACLYAAWQSCGTTWRSA
jgi:hypothetical protein